MFQTLNPALSQNLRVLSLAAFSVGNLIFGMLIFSFIKNFIYNLQNSLNG